MNWEEELTRIKTATEQLNGVADRIATTISIAQEQLNAAGAGASVMIKLIEPELAGWSIGWARKSKAKGWEFVAQWREHTYPLLSAPRLVRIVASEHLTEVANAIASRIESIATKHGNQA